MTRVILVALLVSITSLWACATASLPLATSAGVDPAAAKHNAEGIEQYTMGHWDGAKTHFEAAIRVDPGLAEAHYNLALTLDKLGAHAEATDHFKKAGELAPGYSAITNSSAYRSHVGPPPRDRSGGYGGMY